MQMYLFGGPGFRARQRRRRRVDPLPRVHARALEPARHRRRRPRRAQLAAGGRDGGGLERLVREGLPRLAVPGARRRRRPATSTWAATSTRPRTRCARRGSTARSARRRSSCPGRGAAGSGGYTYGDFGRIEAGQEVHADGEIWAETLWDLRTAVGAPQGAPADHRRHAALAAGAVVPGRAQRDPARRPGRRRRVAQRDLERLPGARHGLLRDDRRRDRRAGAGLLPAAGRGRPARDRSPARSPTPRPARASAARRSRSAGSATGPTSSRRRPTASGNYAIAGVPARTYPSLVISASRLRQPDDAGDRAGGRRGGRQPRRCTRNWAALAGGATVTPGPAATTTPTRAAGRTRRSTSCRAAGGPPTPRAAGKSIVVTLPAAVDVNGFVADPAEACGDDSDSATRRLPDRDLAVLGRRPVVDGRGRHVLASPTATGSTPIAASAAGVRHVRLTLLSAQGGGGFFDMTEFGVHGTPGRAAAAGRRRRSRPPPRRRRRRSSRRASLPRARQDDGQVQGRVRAPCDVTAKLTVDRPTAKKLGLGKNLTAGSLTKKGVKAGRTELTLRLKSKAKKALQKGPKSRTYRARIKVTASYAARAGRLALGPDHPQALKAIVDPPSPHRHDRAPRARARRRRAGAADADADAGSVRAARPSSSRSAARRRSSSRSSARRCAT